MEKLDALDNIVDKVNALRGSCQKDLGHFGQKIVIAYFEKKMGFKIMWKKKKLKKVNKNVQNH